MKHLFIAIISILSIASCSPSSGSTEDHTKLGVNNVYIIIPEDFKIEDKGMQSVYSSPNYSGFEFGIDEHVADYNGVLNDMLGDFPNPFHKTKKAITIGGFEGTQFEGKIMDKEIETIIFGDSLSSVMMSASFDPSSPEQKEIWNKIKGSMIYKRPENFDPKEFQMKKLEEMMSKQKSQ